eukprot:12549041-Ditylum_brightwellii.AAC.1
MSPQKVSQLTNTTATNEYVPMHRLNTSQPMPDTHAISNLVNDVDFSAPRLPDSTRDISNKGSFMYHNNFFS